MLIHDEENERKLRQMQTANWPFFCHSCFEFNTNHLDSALDTIGFYFSGSCSVHKHSFPLRVIVEGKMLSQKNQQQK